MGWRRARPPVRRPHPIPTQDEPADAGTEGTKDESALDERLTLLVTVAELHQSAKQIELEKRAQTEADCAKSAKEGKAMQDEAVKTKYGNLNADKLRV